MLDRHSQRGLGMIGWMAVIAVVGLGFKIGFALFPVYLNEMKLGKAVNKVALAAPATATPADIRKLLQPSWDIDDIAALTPQDIKVVKTARGRALSYEYEHRVPVLGNVSLVVEFKADVPMSGGVPGAGDIP